MPTASASITGLTTATSNNVLRAVRATATAAGIPTRIPVPATIIDSRNTSLITSAGAAPNASRMPSSGVRRASEYDSNP
jgi:hypothetical protein